ncbi:fumarate hydratase [Candidatus Desantisbacteria bacterium CG_4_10_14_0_8_um_filter_48_22]|uniref:Fumarate hydratase n=1 Tax=Candidatus Desantisbacteria bacterium CG_4_10_14_0_8_um_filter_48_22 TaxID=1974543 RepID=A0A2M7SE86_9BACT|nr:MAG: fumarate hydratase [Candidatus Desantisbacteria bacterium CG1_02_49_89]PIV57424.1 MAG: fumarate hydratase [Candidatus Desantisbacteria bacterium CG02_land_8_20_14_3_00_49_13]PIZ17794.1 MAG: fumarate hydratase [Candidatus Desantisbacteria bacterium CG_4_10_14_0_8_um_filter_48_22]
MKKIILPLNNIDIKKLRAGEKVLLTGPVYTARDAAHKRIAQSSKLKAWKLPIDWKGQTIYYAGPAPAPKGMPIGSCGPTTSSRMDRYTPLLLKLGIKGMIGKGNRSEDVKKAIIRSGAVYFVAVGGTGALLSRRITKAKVIAFRDLGPEAIYELELKDFPVLVGINSYGKSIYK